MGRATYYQPNLAFFIGVGGRSGNKQATTRESTGHRTARSVSKSVGSLTLSRFLADSPSLGSIAPQLCVQLRAEEQDGRREVQVEEQCDRRAEAPIGYAVDREDCQQEGESEGSQSPREHGYYSAG